MNSILVALACILPALEAAAEAVPFCLPVDRSEVERRLNLDGAARPAGKRLAAEPRAVRMVYYVVGDGYRAETVAGMKSAIPGHSGPLRPLDQCPRIGRENLPPRNRRRRGAPGPCDLRRFPLLQPLGRARRGCRRGVRPANKCSFDRRRERSGPRKPERPRVGASVREDQRMGSPYPIHGGRQVRFQGGS